MDPLEALGSVTFDWAPTPDDVWQHSAYHVDGMHGNAARTVLSGIAAIERGSASPMGIAIQGQRGAGKTHLLGWVREQAQRRQVKRRKLMMLAGLAVVALIFVAVAVIGGSHSMRDLVKSAVG